MTGQIASLPDTRITCVGKRRGNCGRRHDTLQAAEACIARDNKAAKREGTVGDRLAFLSAELPQDEKGYYYIPQTWAPNLIMRMLL